MFDARRIRLQVIGYRLQVTGYRAEGQGASFRPRVGKQPSAPLADCIIVGIPEAKTEVLEEPKIWSC
jgi:hypothetical protein